MNRTLSQRVRQVEKLLSQAERFVSLKLKERDEYLAELFGHRARLHATAVAAIVIYGEPKINEPLIRAWIRTLRYHGIIVKNEYGREYEYEHGHEHEYKTKDGYGNELKIANAKLYPVIMKGTDEAEKFTEIFRTAPVWLLKFTQMDLDASLLKFDLPKMSEKQLWGEEGLKDLLRWPLLPLGRMTDGNPVPEGACERRISELMDQKIKSISSTDL
jgi:hypothetical protein